MSITDVAIDELLDKLGYRDRAAKHAARTVLETAGFTHARKTKIAAHKLEAVRDALAANLVLVCARVACRESVRRDCRTVLPAARGTHCAICGGSPNRVEVDRALTALAHRGWRRVVVVGGSPGTREALSDLVDGRIELRLVPGTERRTGRDAKADLDWADLVVIWGSTELDHKVSKLYTDAAGRRVVTCAKRGVAAVAVTLVAAAAQPNAR